VNAALLKKAHNFGSLISRDATADAKRYLHDDGWGR
jgi:hypothetical protein